MSTRLSVCLLTRNEEHNIELAIRSVQGLADEVIVAESGSTDRTAEIARGLGARVIPFTWDDDFSAGRNVALAAATGDWVLWLNPDEELRPESHPTVRSLIDGDDRAFGYLARVRNVPRGERLDQFSETWDLRLYRRRADLQYVGRVHPSFRPEVARAVGEEGQHVGPSEVLIRRHAYTSVLDQGKLRWAARLFERELTDRPNQLRYLIEYGRTLLLLGDPKGHEVMAEALEQVTPAAEAAEAPDAGVQVLLEYVINTPSNRYRGRLSPAQAVTLALKWFPNSPPLLWSLAGASFRTGNFATAAEILGRLVHLGETGTYDHSRGFDPRIVGPWAKLNLAQCQRALGTPGLARLLLHSLLEDPEFVEQARSLLAEIDRPTPAGT
jgi:hypothetical protein